ncbi:PE/PPE C-terminal domain-containing protein, partial [Mycobacterium sp. 1465703.0]|uniref:PE/PPE C-terminal domain-containing protein n=1 Tax=Mycobacterium sp. 1465703.0 TaxID=1834078 RepID=UPI000A59562E
TPPNTTTPEADSDQAAAVAKAVSEPAGNTAQSTSQALSLNASPTVQAPAAITNASSNSTQASLLNALQTADGPGLPTPSNNWLGLNPTLYTVLLKQDTGLGYFSNGIVAFWSQLAQQLVSGPGGSTAGASGAWYPTPQFATLGLGNLGGVGHVGAVSAGAGQAGRIGMLSVPQNWATLTSAVSPVSDLEATPLQAAGSGGANPAANGLLRGMPIGSVGRRGAAAGYVNKYGFRYSVLTRPPSAG